MIHHTRRVSPDIILQSADTEFRYDFKSSQVFRLRRKKEKEIYFKNLKKTGNIFSAHYKLHLRTLTLYPSLFSSRSSNSRAKNTHPTTRTLLSSVLENDLSVVIYSLQRSAIFIRTIYHLPFFRALSIPASLILVPLRLSTRSIYLFTSLLYILSPVF